MDSKYFGKLLAFLGSEMSSADTNGIFNLYCSTNTNNCSAYNGMDGYCCFVFGDKDDGPVGC